MRKNLLWQTVTLVATALVLLLLTSPTEANESRDVDGGVVRGEDASGLFYIEQNDRFDGPSFPVYYDDPGSIHSVAAAAVPTFKGTPWYFFSASIALNNFFFKQKH